MLAQQFLGFDLKRIPKIIYQILRRATERIFRPILTYETTMENFKLDF